MKLKVVFMRGIILIMLYPIEAIVDTIKEMIAHTIRPLLIAIPEAISPIDETIFSADFIKSFNVFT